MARTKGPMPCASPDRSPAFEAFVAPARARPELWRLCSAPARRRGLARLVGGWSAAAGGRLRFADRRADPAARLSRALRRADPRAGARGAAAAPAQARQPDRAGGLRPRHSRSASPWSRRSSSSSALPLDRAGCRRSRPRGLGGLAAAGAAGAAVQISAEELAFRGYLMQGLAARFRARAVWWGLPALLFGLMHWNPATFGPNAWLVVLTAGLIGLILAMSPPAPATFAGDGAAFRQQRHGAAAGRHALAAVGASACIWRRSPRRTPAALRAAPALDLAGTARRLRRLARASAPGPGGDCIRRGRASI